MIVDKIEQIDKRIEDLKALRGLIQQAVKIDPGLFGEAMQNGNAGPINPVKRKYKKRRKVFQMVGTKPQIRADILDLMRSRRSKGIKITKSSTLIRDVKGGVSTIQAVITQLWRGGEINRVQVGSYELAK